MRWRTLRRSHLKAVAFALAVACLGAALRVATAAEAARPISVSEWTDLKLSIQAADMLWDPTRNVILASINPSVIGFGNQVVEIDPSTGSVGRQVPVGANPGDG